MSRDLKANSNNYLYLGTIHYEIFGNMDAAEKALKKGLERNNKNISLLTALNKLYAEKDKIALNADLSMYWKRNANLKAAEKLYQKTYKSEEDHFQMAELYFVEEMYDEAIKIVDNNIGSNLTDFRWFNLKGQLLMAQEAYKKAISAFKQAKKLEAHNLNTRVNLGNAYMRDKNYSDAEQEFKKVLQRDPNNVDAMIGLGEIRLNRSSDDSDDSLLDAAEKYFHDAIKLGKSQKGSKRLDLFAPKSKNGKRKYKDLKLSDLYYSLGYIKTKQYEKNKFGLANSYLNEALSNFVKSLQSNPDNLKAASAKEKIESRVKPSRRTSKLETLGAWIVTGMAFLVFVFGQYFFYFSHDDVEKHAINKESISYLETVLPLNENTSKKLKTLTGVTFEDRNALISAINKIVGAENIASNRALVNSIDFVQTVPEENSEFLPAGYYVLISFGSILFMIAGLYLRNLLKLKVGVIEIEKNSPSAVTEISLLGIQK